MHECTHTNTHTYMCTYMDSCTSIYIYIHTCIHSCMSGYIQRCINIHMYVHACLLKTYILSEFTVWNFCVCKFPNFWKLGNTDFRKFRNPETVLICIIANLLLSSSVAISAQVSYSLMAILISERTNLAAKCQI